MKLWFSKGKAANEANQAAETPKPDSQPAAAPEAPQSTPQPAASAPAAAAPQSAAPTPQPILSKPAAPAPKGPASNQRELYRNLMNSLYDSILLVDEKGFVVDCNTRVEHTFGYTTGDLWGVSLQQLLKGFGLQVLRRITEPLAEGRPVIINGTGLRKEGTPFNAEICVSKVKLTNAENLLFSVRDITKRIIAEREKIRAQLKAEQPTHSVTPIRLRCVPKKNQAAS